MCAYFSSLPARVSRSSSKTDARRFSVRARCITFLLKISLPSNDEEKDETDKKRKRKEKILFELSNFSLFRGSFSFERSIRTSILTVSDDIIYLVVSTKDEEVFIVKSIEICV